MPPILVSAWRNVNQTREMPGESVPQRNLVPPSSRARPWSGLPWARPWRWPGRLVWVALVASLAGCRYHVGTPSPSAGLRVEAVEAPVVEPAVADALAAALGAAIRREGAAGERAISARVLQARFEPAASRDGHVYAWEASLVVDFTLTGAAPRLIQLRRSAPVASPTGDAAQIAQLRADALAGLAAVLADEAVSFFLYAPAAEPSLPGGEP